MRLNSIIIILLIIGSVSCKSKEKKIVPLPFSEEKVIDILIDMHYAGEASRITRKINHDSLLKVYTNEVLEIQQIDSTQLADLIELLQSNLDTYYDIEKKVHSKIKELNEK